MFTLMVGMVRLFLVFYFKHDGRCGEEDNRPGFLKDFHYMYFAILLFGLSILTCVVVSLFTEKLPASYVSSKEYFSIRQQIAFIIGLSFLLLG